jgi:hypothetical protein
MTIKELQEDIISNMKKWQQLEDATIVITGQMMEKTNNPIIHLVMEIIQRDSQMHYRIQEWIADSLENKTVSLTPEEIGEVWNLAEQALVSLKGKSMVIQSYLINYLLEDERKHTNLLSPLESIKRRMYPYG